MSNIGTTPFYLGDILLEGTNEIPSSFVASMVAQGTTKAQINSTAPSSSTSIPITVAQTNVGNLILSAYNVVINPANGTTPITLWLLNNGSQDITNIQFSSVSDYVTAAPIAPSPCDGRLVAGDACSFSVNANSGQSSGGSTTILINFNDGSVPQSVPFNISYIAESPAPSLVLSLGAGSFHYVPVNTTAYLPLLVTNASGSSGTTFSGISFSSLPSSEFAYASSDEGSSCALIGQVLDSGDSCTMILSYTPTTSNEASTFNELVTATYYNGESSIASELSYIPYSSIIRPALLMTSPNSASYTMQADGIDYAVGSFTISNVGGTPATMPTLTTANLVSNTFPSSIVDNNCNGVSLAPNASCVISYKFGPTLTAYSNLSESFQYNYLQTPNSDSYVTAYSFQTFNSYTGR